MALEYPTELRVASSTPVSKLRTRERKPLAVGCVDAVRVDASNVVGHFFVGCGSAFATVS